MRISTLPNVTALKALGSSESRAQLQGLRNALIDPQSGRVRSGYLRLSARGSLNVGHWMTKGSKANAIASVKELIQSAYGERLKTIRQRDNLNHAIDTYLQRSGQAMGSKSFVKLIDKLEALLPPDDGQDVSHARNQHAITGKLSLDDFVLYSPSDKIQALAKNSPIGGAALAQFEALSKHLKPETLAHFSQLMFPSLSKTNQVAATQALTEQAPRTFVMGDADGSMGRMLLHVIASGTGRLPPEKMPLLAKVLDREFLCNELEDLLNFQEDTHLAYLHSELAGALVVTPQTGHNEPACLFMGDILSDRLTNNQKAMSNMIFKLKGYDLTNLQKPPQNTGVRFIAGNHDMAVIPREVFGEPNVVWGGGAAWKLTSMEYKNLLLSCFEAAVYAGGVLSTHQGVAASKIPGYYQTGLNVGINNQQLMEQKANGGATLKSGDKVENSLSIKADTPEALAQAMNELFQKVLQQGGDFYELVSTNFRPKDKDMTLKAMWFSPEDHMDFRQIHGHDGDANEGEPGVTNLNPRSATAATFAPASTVITYPAQLTDSLIAAIPFT